MPALSIILPVYNSAPYLDSCLRSVLQQTFTDYELICINDGSNDASEEILKKYQASDSRMKVIAQRNMGPSIARNAGLAIATGEYVGFMDSDDFVDPDYFGSMYGTAERTGADILLNNNVVRENEEGSEPYRGSFYPKQSPEGEYLDSAFAAANTICLLYAHLYRRTLLEENNVRFPDMRLPHEDEYFHRTAHRYAEKVYAYKGPGYHYVKRPGSIMESRQKACLPYIRCFTELRNRFADELTDNSFNVPMLSPMLFSLLTDDEEYFALKAYLESLEGYLSRSGAFISDFYRFAIGCVLESADPDECRSRLTKFPLVRYGIRGRMKRRNPAVSIIMPVHNSACYLKRTLESILSQSFRDIELIAVNDGSTDRSLEMMTCYAQWDIRMKIIDLPENQGVSKARNAGLDAAEGEYVFFIDSDDWLDRNHIGEMLRRMEESGADIETNVCYACEYPEQGKRTLSDFGWAPEEGGTVDSRIVQRLFSPVVWASLYRRSYLNGNGIRFIEVKGGAEDIHFSGLSYLCSDKVYVFRGPALHYLQRPGSLMHGKKNGFHYIESFKALHDELAARGIPTDGMKLFFVESLFIETEEQFTFVKEYMTSVEGEFRRNESQYSELERFLMDISLRTPDYGTFRKNYNANIQMSFIRSRLKR